MEQERSRHENQCIALAGIFQSADIAYRVASKQPFDMGCYETSLTSILVVDADSIQSIYPNLSGLSQGFRLQNQYLAPQLERTPELVEKMKYVLGLIRLEKALKKSPKMLNQLQNDLTQCQRQFELKDHRFDGQMIERLAHIYLSTIGQLGFRIIVQGKADTLNLPGNAQRIRCVFLAGIRATVLWHQIGGRQWHLILRRNKLRQALNHLPRG